MMSQFTENISAIRAAAHEDMAQSAIRDRAVFGGSMALLGAHEFGMETALVFTATHAAELSANNPIITGLATAALSLTVETTLTHGVARSIETFKQTMTEVRDRYFGNAALSSGVQARGSRLRDVVDNTTLALTLGAPGVLINDYAKQPQKDHQEHLATGKRTSRNLAIFNGAWSSVMSASAWISEKFGVDSVGNAIVDVARSPFTYLGLLGTFASLRVINSITGRRAKRRAEAANGEA